MACTCCFPLSLAGPHLRFSPGQPDDLRAFGLSFRADVARNFIHLRVIPCKRKRNQSRNAELEGSSGARFFKLLVIGQALK